MFLSLYIQDGRLCCNYDFRCSSLGQPISVTTVSDDSWVGHVDDSYQGTAGLSFTGENISQIRPPQAQIQEANTGGITTDGATNVNTPGSKDLSKFKSGGQGDENTRQQTDNSGTVPLFINSATALNNTVVTINNGTTTDVVYASQNSSSTIGVSDHGTGKHINETEESGVQKTITTNVEDNGNQNNCSNKGGTTADNSHAQKREAIMKRVSKFVYVTEEEGVAEERKVNNAQVKRHEGAEE